MLRLSCILLFITLPAWPETRLQPTFTSEVQKPTQSLITPLLKAACGDGVRTTIEQGRKIFGCGDSMEEVLASRSRPRHYDWPPYVLWQADGVIFGHFLSPTSEDAAVNCFGCEGHPNLFGGTLLLTKKSGKWEPVWYKAGVITRHCRRIALSTGRQILFCEERDGGMGHSIHGLYTVDFTRPKFAWDSVVLAADSFSDAMLGGVQAQSIERVVFEKTDPGELRVRVYARHGRMSLPEDYPGERMPQPKLSRYEIAFELTGDKFSLIPEYAPAAKLFGVQ